MPQTREVSERVRAHLHELNAQLSPGVAEDVALAMVRGAGEAFRELSPALGPAATRRLLGALQLDAQAVLAILTH